MFGSKIKLDSGLLARCKEHAERAGYSSVEEFVTHVLERELRPKEKQTMSDEEEMTKRLQGLGYIE
jgi:hypothetical protein